MEKVILLIDGVILLLTREYLLTSQFLDLLPDFLDLYIMKVLLSMEVILDKK